MVKSRLVTTFVALAGLLCSYLASPLPTHAQESFTHDLASIANAAPPGYQPIPCPPQFKDKGECYTYVTKR
jgi:hypothetical protein